MRAQHWERRSTQFKHLRPLTRNIICSPEQRDLGHSPSSKNSHDKQNYENIKKKKNQNHKKEKTKTKINSRSRLCEDHLSALQVICGPICSRASRGSNGRTGVFGLCLWGSGHMPSSSPASRSPQSPSKPPLWSYLLQRRKNKPKPWKLSPPGDLIPPPPSFLAISGNRKDHPGN